MIDDVNNSPRVRDFESARPLSGHNNSAAEEESGMLIEQLKDTSGRGAGFWYFEIFIVNTYSD